MLRVLARKKIYSLRENAAGNASKQTATIKNTGEKVLPVLLIK